MDTTLLWLRNVVGAGDGPLIHDDTCVVLEDDSVNRGHLTRRRVVEAYPFNFAEASYYRNGKIYVPVGAALTMKELTIREVIGPMRLICGVPFSVPSGGCYDPVTDETGKRITHRPSRGAELTRSQHSYQPDRGATGTAWDIKPRGMDATKREHIVRWLKDLDREFRQAGKLRISIGVYAPHRGDFLHIDLRLNGPARWRVPSSGYDWAA